MHACRRCRRRDVERPESIRATLGTCEEGCRGISGGKGKKWGEKSGPVMTKGCGQEKWR
jgi:hypothetical protein